MLRLRSVRSKERNLTGETSSGVAVLTRSDGEAFECFYLSEMPVQVRRAALILGSDETARDVVQDAFVSLLPRWHEVRVPQAYLSRSVLNGCRDVIRHLARGRKLAQENLPSDHSDRHEIMFDVLGRLPFNHRAAIVLRYYEGLTETEIALALNCRPGSIGPWIRRGLNTMRKELS